MTGIVDGIIALARDHPGWAAALVFTTAFLEAIVLVGLFVPGTSILVAVGAMLAFAGVPAWPVILWGAAGAIVGNTVSFELGRRHKGAVLRTWPFSARPQLWTRAEAFLTRHGAKSVAIGRFLPVIRPMIPFAAGAAGMATSRFQLVNVVSAALWAPAYILPGVLGGWSLGLLSGVSKRLAVVLAILLTLAVLAAWGLRWLWGWSVPRLGGRLAVLAVAAEGRPGWGSGAARLLFHPERAGWRVVALLASALTVAVLVLANLTEEVLERGAVMRADVAISHLVQNLRNPWADSLLTGATLLGDASVTLALTISIVAYLIFRRAYRLGAGLATVMVACAVFVPLAKMTLKISRPTPLFGGFDAFGFPSGHATSAAALFGLLSWLFVRLRPNWISTVGVAASATAIVLIAGSRVYLSAHWPSDVAAGLLFGAGLTLICAIVYRRYDLGQIRSAELLAVAAFGLSLFGGLHLANTFEGARSAYEVNAARSSVVSWSTWLDTEPPGLPARRIDLKGDWEESFAFQWAGSRASLRQYLAHDGWRVAEPWSVSALSRQITQGATPSLTPAAPVSHDGRAADLTYISTHPETADTRRVLRAWRTTVSLDGARDCPIWLVSIIRQPLIKLAGGGLWLGDEQDDEAGGAPPLRRVAVGCRPGVK